MQSSSTIDWEGRAVYYRLEWAFNFTDDPVIGQAQGGSKADCVGAMQTDVEAALGGRWSSCHAATMRGLTGTLMRRTDDEPMEISSKGVFIRLTTLPGDQ